jgi:hypothetical protein
MRLNISVVKGGERFSPSLVVLCYCKAAKGEWRCASFVLTLNFIVFTWFLQL